MPGSPMSMFMTPKDGVLIMSNDGDMIKSGKGYSRGKRLSKTDCKQLLEKAGIESLKDRRERQFAKFAKKASENDKYKHWFPKNPTERITRKTLVYKEEKATGNRLYNSPIFAMRRLLNNSQSPLDNVDLTGLFNMP